MQKCAIAESPERSKNDDFSLDKNAKAEEIKNKLSFCF